MKRAYLTPPDVDDETFTFPVINQQALFVRKCYHDLYELVTKLPTAVVGSVRILLTGTAGIGKSAFLIYFIIRCHVNRYHIWTMLESSKPHIGRGVPRQHFSCI